MTTTLISTKTLPDTLDVYVDQEDIQLGIRGSEAFCAVARAIRRTLALQGYEVQWVRVHHSADIAAGEEIARFGYGDAWNFIRAFDRGENPDPRVVHLTSQER